jgi:hypothetical protein
VAFSTSGDWSLRSPAVVSERIIPNALIEHSERIEDRSPSLGTDLKSEQTDSRSQLPEQFDLMRTRNASVFVETPRHSFSVQNRQAQGYSEPAATPGSAQCARRLAQSAPMYADFKSVAWAGIVQALRGMNQTVTH